MVEHERHELNLTPTEGDGPVPLGWRLLFWGLIAFGAYYLWAYTPAFTGWTQAGEVDGAAGAGESVLATILFTTLAVIAAGSILFTRARRRR